MKVSCIYLKSEEITLGEISYSKAYRLPALCDWSMQFDSNCLIKEACLVVHDNSTDPECQLVEAFGALDMYPPLELCGNYAYSEYARLLCEWTLATMELDLKCIKVLMAKSREVSNDN